MRTALCFTPDLAFFRQAVCAAASVLAQPDSGAFDVFIVCEAGDVAPGFERLEPRLRARINLLTVDFSSYELGVRGRGPFSRAVFRRLFLDRVLPAAYLRIVAIDSDMLITQPGLGRLARLDLAGTVLAAAYDMIFLMDCKGGALAQKFQAYRRALGLSLETPYFNAGLMVIDRAGWSAQDLGERAIAALRDAPPRYPFMEQSALNQLIAGAFAPLSPRYNFMGDFFLLGLEKRIDPIVLHFVNRPKPWQFESWRGETRFALAYHSWFAASPWPDALEGSPRPARKPSLTPLRRTFAGRLLSFLDTRKFVDVPAAPPAGEW